MKTHTDYDRSHRQRREERDAGDAGIQYMLLAMAVVEIGGIVYMALAA